MLFKGVVKDLHYDTDQNDSEHSGFSTADEAFEWARKTAKETGFTHVSYWVDPEDQEAEVWLENVMKCYFETT